MRFSLSATPWNYASVAATNSCSIAVAAAAADVSVVKSGPAAVCYQHEHHLGHHGCECGSSLAAGVTISDTLPPGTTLVSTTPSQGSCTGTSTITCSLGTVPASVWPRSNSW